MIQQRSNFLNPFRLMKNIFFKDDTLNFSQQCLFKFRNKKHLHGVQSREYDRKRPILSNLTMAKVVALVGITRHPFSYPKYHVGLMKCLLSQPLTME